MEKRKAAFVIIHDETHFIMILRRGGDLGFPGGKCESGESLLQTARREANEELNISPRLIPVEGCELLSVDETKKFQCNLFITPQKPRYVIDGVVNGAYKATHSKEVSGVLRIKKRKAVIQNLLEKHPLAPTVREELINFMKTLED